SCGRRAWRWTAIWPAKYRGRDTCASHLTRTERTAFLERCSSASPNEGAQGSGATEPRSRRRMAGWRGDGTVDTRGNIKLIKDDAAPRPEISQTIVRRLSFKTPLNRALRAGPTDSPRAGPRSGFAAKAGIAGSWANPAASPAPSPPIAKAPPTVLKNIVLAVATPLCSQA